MKQIQTQLLNYASSYLEDVCIPTLEELDPYPKMTEKQTTLYSLGFKNCAEIKRRDAELKRIEKAAKRNKEKQGKIDKLKNTCSVYIKCRKVFGPDTLLIRYEDFYKLMRKNGLVCGMFENYTGEIPDDKLKEIQNLINIPGATVNNLPKTDRSSNYRVPSEVKTLYPIKEVSGMYVKRKLPDELARFPFVIPKGNLSDSCYPNYFPASNTDILGLELGRYSTNRDYRIDAVKNNGSKFFICAPEKEMDNSWRVKHTLKRVEDPMICSYTDYGILIHTRWGEEANLDIIKRHEKLNSLVDQRAKELGVEL